MRDLLLRAHELQQQRTQEAVEQQQQQQQQTLQQEQEVEAAALAQEQQQQQQQQQQLLADAAEHLATHGFAGILDGHDTAAAAGAGKQAVQQCLARLQAQLQLEMVHSMPSMHAISSIDRQRCGQCTSLATTKPCARRCCSNCKHHGNC